ncbi:MAG: hypothetical protein GEU28_13395 [Dehalococcoidia bacterium]|nr:hypothetical protein [Dehalococcoidia bacterium]
MGRRYGDAAPRRQYRRPASLRSRRDELEGEVQRVVGRLLQLPPLTMRGTKESAVRSLQMPLDEALRFELLMSRTLRSTDDAREGPAAFAEKRQPDYTGK